jgi:hypothetical protein
MAEEGNQWKLELCGMAVGEVIVVKELDRLEDMFDREA